MTTALLISGYLRTFKFNLPIIKKIISDLQNVDIYIHITKDEINEDKYLNVINLDNDIILIQNELNPKSLVCEGNVFFSKNKKINNLYNSWFKFSKLNSLKKINEINSDKKYDLVIKYRPDLVVNEIDFLKIYDNKDKIYIPSNSLIDKNKLSNKDDNYICDLMAFGSSELMDRYFLIFDFLKKYTKKFKHVSETILYHYLNDNNITYELIDIDLSVLLSECNVFAICGDSGSGKTTLGNLLKKFFDNSFMLECDRYHKWERGDSNWKKYTHLNPEANFISKMEEDIFNLKIGKKIFQVDYDHSVGKFTDNEEITPTENTIVCGLHSLYTKNENIYNLKIFVDTEEELKKKWKINRDVNERGYDLEKVLTQIENRKNDFKTYILPQKKKSDIIIKFYNKYNDDISLKIMINNKFDLSPIYEHFSNLKIPFKLKKNKKFNEFFFDKYFECMVWGDEKYPFFNNFYDYIIYIIIKLNY
jgi:uridine kinase